MAQTLRHCPRCDRDLPLRAFNFKNRRTGRLQAYCRACSRVYAYQHYLANTDYYVAKAAEAKARRRAVRTWRLGLAPGEHVRDPHGQERVIVGVEYHVVRLDDGAFWHPDEVSPPS